MAWCTRAGTGSSVLVGNRKKPLPDGKRLLDVGTGEVLYGVGATSPLLSLGMPQICTSDMARRDCPRELPPCWDRHNRSCGAFASVMVLSVYEALWGWTDRAAKNPSEFIGASHAMESGSSRPGRRVAG